VVNEFRLFTLQEVAEARLASDRQRFSAILNVGSSGKLSSDRAIAEYAADIWSVEPCLVSGNGAETGHLW
jgi:glucan phosphorylase